MEFEKVKEAVNETFIASNEDFNYKIEVQRNGKNIISVTVSVSVKSEEGEKHIGYLSMSNGSKNTSFPVDHDVVQHISVFEAFLESLKE